MKKYLLFAFNSHFPKGGASDLIGDFDTAEDAHTAFLNHGDRALAGSMEHFQIYDTEERKIAFTSESIEGSDGSDFEEDS